MSSVWTKVMLIVILLQSGRRLDFQLSPLKLKLLEILSFGGFLHDCGLATLFFFFFCFAFLGRVKISYRTQLHESFTVTKRKTHK